MANGYYYRWGDQELIVVPVDDTTVVEIGDFIIKVSAGDTADDSTLTTGYGAPADYMVDGGDAAANRELGADQLLGIAMSAHLSGAENDNIIVATAGVFELIQQTAAAIELGAEIEIYADATGCSNQLIVAGSTSPIGHCVELKAATGTGVMVKLIPQLFNQSSD